MAKAFFRNDNLYTLSVPGYKIPGIIVKPGKYVSGNFYLPEYEKYGLTSVGNDIVVDPITDLVYDYVETVTGADMYPAVPEGLATLDATGKLDLDQLPQLAISDTYVVTTQAERLGLNVQVGDVAIQTDNGFTYILAESPATDNAHWKTLAAASGILGSGTANQMAYWINGTTLGGTDTITLNPALSSKWLSLKYAGDEYLNLGYNSLGPGMFAGTAFASTTVYNGYGFFNGIPHIFTSTTAAFGTNSANFITFSTEANTTPVMEIPAVGYTTKPNLRLGMTAAQTASPFEIIDSTTATVFKVAGTGQVDVNVPNSTKHVSFLCEGVEVAAIKQGTIGTLGFGCGDNHYGYNIYVSGPTVIPIISSPQYAYFADTGSHVAITVDIPNDGIIFGNSQDVGLARSSAGVVKVTDGSTGYGSLIVSQESTTPSIYTLGTGYLTLSAHSSLTRERIKIGNGGGGISLESGNGGGGISLESTCGIYLNGPTFAQVKVTPNTGTATPAATDSRTVYTNEGDADGSTITLPSAVAGLEYTIAVQAAQTVTVTAATGDTIRVAASVTAPGGSITSNFVGSIIKLTAINATEWFGQITGEWTF